MVARGKDLPRSNRGTPGKKAPNGCDHSRSESHRRRNSISVDETSTKYRGTIFLPMSNRSFHKRSMRCGKECSTLRR